ncbi:MAG: 50S ribosomal protein L6 [Nitrospira sp.]|nr:50S ribosomal protein L6 [Nitrospira sp.]MCB9709956.1 50S ribosomal protein L6 [Nitrospiraceae bacterium]MDR4487178.1 50S ribosomal protein L6 [Nitrospirales bacterium]MCA9465386.1 50S ribosomal protein L6 [Nitrospira sp.]MCA9474623.1 50S ribosomal protein L6 [Nitrospira sp.]
MSRIGKRPIPIPKGVEVQVKGSLVSVKGPLGILQWDLFPGIQARVEDGSVILTRSSETNKLKALHGLSRAEIANHIVGVMKGYQKNLEIMGVGYRAQAQGNSLTFTVGYAHPVSLALPKGVEVSVDKQTLIALKGIDKRVVSQSAAQIRTLKVPDVYKQKGIKYLGEVLRKKAGKAGKK